MKQLFTCLIILCVLLVVSGDALTLLDSMLHQFFYISILVGGIVYLGRCFRRACIDK